MTALKRVNKITSLEFYVVKKLKLEILKLIVSTYA